MESSKHLRECVSLFSHVINTCVFWILVAIILLQDRYSLCRFSLETIIKNLHQKQGYLFFFFWKRERKERYISRDTLLNKK